SFTLFPYTTPSDLHRSFGAIEDVVDQLLTVGQGFFLAVDVARFFFIYDVEVIAAGVTGDVDVLANLDVSIRAQNGQASVSPGVKSIRGKPVYPYVSSTAVAPDCHITKVFELRILRVVNIAGLRSKNFCACRAGEVKELIELM